MVKVCLWRRQVNIISTHSCTCVNTPVRCQSNILELMSQEWASSPLSIPESQCRSSVIGAFASASSDFKRGTASEASTSSFSFPALWTSSATPFSSTSVKSPRCARYYRKRWSISLKSDLAFILTNLECLQLSSNTADPKWICKYDQLGRGGLSLLWHQVKG